MPHDPTDADVERAARAMRDEEALWRRSGPFAVRGRVIVHYGRTLVETPEVGASVWDLRLYGPSEVEQQAAFDALAAEHKARAALAAMPDRYAEGFEAGKRRTAEIARLTLRGASPTQAGAHYAISVFDSDIAAFKPEDRE